MNDNKCCRWAVILIWLLLIIGAWGFSSDVNAEADTSANDMNIHAIKMTDPSGNPGMGDAVLVESAGEFLLMDTACGNYDGALMEYPSTAPDLIAYLRKVGAGVDHPLDIYISHTHTDHYGGLQNICEAGISIRNLYLPAPEIGKAVREDRQFVYNMAYRLKDGYGIENIIYLAPAHMGFEDANSSLSIGNASIEILGPMKIYTPENAEGTNTQLENNNSLCAMITCGDFKFLSMADALTLSERNIVAEYGDALKADLMKQDHHGHAGANDIELVDVVKPQRAFACSEQPGYFSVVVQRGYLKYGDSFPTADLQKTVVLQKNSETGKIEKSVCNHDVTQKTFSRTSESLTSDTLKVTCEECGATETLVENHACTHKFTASGRCKNSPLCKYVCPHETWKNGVCRACGFVCKHKKINPTTNQYIKKNGKYISTINKKTRRCDTCKLACKHKWNKKKGRCVTCGLWCSHGKWTKFGKCKKCGFVCRHLKINKKTHKYVKKNGKYISTVNKKLHKCKVCKRVIKPKKKLKTKKKSKKKK